MILNAPFNEKCFMVLLPGIDDEETRLAILKKAHTRIPPWKLIFIQMFVIVSLQVILGIACDYFGINHKTERLIRYTVILPAMIIIVFQWRRRVARKYVSHVLREDASRCNSCGYDITGLQTNRCPECGLPIIPYIPDKTSKSLFGPDGIIARTDVSNETEPTK